VILYIIPLAAAATALGRRATSTPRLASSIVANLDSKGLQKIKNKYSVHVQGWQHTSIAKAAMNLLLTVAQATCVKQKCVWQ
jgi:hypothetical protein